MSMGSNRTIKAPKYRVHDGPAVYLEGCVADGSRVDEGQQIATVFSGRLSEPVKSPIRGVVTYKVADNGPRVLQVARSVDSLAEVA